jgi:hypothetical protein
VIERVVFACVENVRVRRRCRYVIIGAFRLVRAATAACTTTSALYRSPTFGDVGDVRSEPVFPTIQTRVSLNYSMPVRAIIVKR